LIEPPKNLPWSPESLVAWHRITGNLEEIGAWEPIYQSMCFVAATQAHLYLQSCRIHGPRAPVTQECREIARLLLADMLCIDSVVEVRESDNGVDLDLLEVCLPLENADA
jgi:hypothetical protein